MPKHQNTKMPKCQNTKKAIPEGVHHRLGELTTLDKTDGSKPVSEIHPEHHQKPEKAGLVKGKLKNGHHKRNQIKEWATQKASQEHRQKKSREQRERDGSQRSTKSQAMSALVPPANMPRRDSSNKRQTSQGTMKRAQNQPQWPGFLRASSLTGNQETQVQD